MTNMGALLKSEISRLSRREIRKEVQPLRKAATSYRREIASLKRSIAVLERRTKNFARTVADQGGGFPPSDGSGTRFVAKGLTSLRKRLGLSASDLARLLGVSMQSIYNWEQKKATPRKEQVVAIAALRFTGKKDARRRLDATKTKSKRSATKPKSRTKTVRARGRT